MKRFLVFFSLILIFSLFTIVPPVFATCKKDITDAEKASFPVEASFSLTSEEFATCKPEDTAARGVQPNVSYTIHCQEESEKNSFFSLKAALCGSSDERGPNNATCWTCGGDFRCTGFGQFALGQSDPLVAPPINERQPVNPGDTNMDQVWRVAGSSIPQTGFTYNGLHYDKPPGDLIVCTSDNRACGAPESTQCMGKFPETTPPPGQAAPIIVPGETNFVQIPVGKTDRITYNLFQNTGLLNFYLSGYARVALHEQNLLNPNLQYMSRAIFDATSFALKPFMLQQQTVNATNCQRYQAAGRICVYQGATLINTEEQNQPISKQIYQSGECNPEGMNERFQGIRQLAAISTKYTQLNQDYNTPYTPLSIDPEKPLLCQERDEGVPLQTTQHPGPGEHVFVFPGSNQILGLVGVFQKITDVLAEVPYTIVYQPTILTPHEANPWCLGPGCDDPALQRVKYPVDPAVVKGGPSFATFEPYAHDFNKFALHGGDKKQQFDTEFSPGEVREGQTAFSYANREIQGSNYLFCMISPLMNNHLGLFTNGECDQDFSRENPASAQHGSLPVPLGISSILDGLRPRPDGILGLEFLEKYAQTLITTPLAESQRALLMARIQELIDRYVANGAWPNSQLGNIGLQNQIRNFAASYGFNEAFLYALWIEETHASSVGDYPFGCGGYTQFADSLNCLANDPTVQTYIRGNLGDALCMYADGHRNCDFSAHPNFVRNLTYYYDYLTLP